MKCGWVLAAGLLASPGLAGTVRYVDAGATGAADGTSWSDAHTNLQTATGASVAGDELWVRAGDYGPFTQQESVAVFGGFAGHEWTREARDWSANVTRINGQGGAAVRAALHSVLDGVTITNSGGAGGAFMASRVGCELRNCRIVGHVTGDAVQVVQSGGGIGAEVRVVNCVFESNAETALFVSGRTNIVPGPHPVTIDRCRFFGNGGSGSGGAIRAENVDASLDIVNCVFSWNRATLGGALHVTYSSYSAATPVTVRHCTFAGNSASTGQSIYLSYEDAKLALVNCIVWGADRDQIRLQNGSPTLSLTQCLLQGGVDSVYRKFGVVEVSGDVLSGDPQFADADGADGVGGTADDNVRLTAGSPCVDAGSATGASGHDADGAARPQGQQVDIGAYEFSGGRPASGLTVTVR